VAVKEMGGGEFKSGKQGWRYSLPPLDQKNQSGSHVNPPKDT